MNDEIALFIDFENIRYSLINVQRREPDPQELIGLARRFGTVMVAKAYADWARQPDFFKGSLMAAMIDRVDCPAKVRERFRQNPSQSFYQPAPFTSNPPSFPQGPYNPFQARNGQSLAEDEAEEGYDEEDEELTTAEALADEENQPEDEQVGNESDELDTLDESEDDPHGRNDQPYAYNNNGGYHQQPQLITQSTVDLNMLMDIIENVFDRPSINTFVLMTGDRDFTRICARLKVRLNKRVIIVGVPGTVSRDLISASDHFVPLGVPGGAPFNDRYNSGNFRQPGVGMPYGASAGPVQPDEPGFIQFLDYIDSHWSWRTIGGVANFIGDPFNPKNRFRGRLTRDSARDLLRICVDEGILFLNVDPQNGENLRLNREHPAVLAVLNETTVQ